MTDLWDVLWTTFRPGGNALLGLIVLSPFLIWAGFGYCQFRFQPDVTPPQQEKVLRPPGHSLQELLEELFYATLQTLSLTSLMFLIATLGAVSAAKLWGVHATSYAIFFSGLFIVSAIPGMTLMRRAIINHSQNAGHSRSSSARSDRGLVYARRLEKVAGTSTVGRSLKP